MIPLYKPYMPKVLPEIERILYSGALAYGKWGHQFEKRLSSFIGVENLLSTNSYALFEKHPIPYFEGRLLIGSSTPHSL